MSTFLQSSVASDRKSIVCQGWPSLGPTGRRFGAWDGTSMATPHVTGLAALVLAHHPDFRGAFRSRDARRVEHLFQILKQTATPLPFGDAARSGAGLPNALRALGIGDTGRPCLRNPCPDARRIARRAAEAAVANRVCVACQIRGAGGIGQLAG